MITLKLPKPPSINHLYGYTSKGGFARSYVTKQGKDWFENAMELVKSQTRNRKPITTELEVEINLYTARHQDVDNVSKPILDLLQKKYSHLIENDAQVYRLTIEKFKSKVVDERVEVFLTPYEGQ